MPRCSDHRVVSLYWCQLLGWARWLLSDSPGTMPSRFCLLAVCLSIHARKKRKYIKNLTIGTSFNLDLTCQFRRGYFLNSFVSLNLNPQLKNCVNDPLQRSKLDTLIRNPQTLHRLVFILGGVHITLLVSNHMFYLSVVSPSVPSLSLPISITSSSTPLAPLWSPPPPAPKSRSHPIHGYRGEELLTAGGGQLSTARPWHAEAAPLSSARPWPATVAMLRARSGRRAPRTPGQQRFRQCRIVIRLVGCIPRHPRQANRLISTYMTFALFHPAFTTPNLPLPQPR